MGLDCIVATHTIGVKVSWPSEAGVEVYRTSHGVCAKHDFYEDACSGLGTIN
jgi:hypothetical protein